MIKVTLCVYGHLLRWKPNMIMKKFILMQWDDILKGNTIFGFLCSSHCLGFSLSLTPPGLTGLPSQLPLENLWESMCDPPKLPIPGIINSFYCVFLWVWRSELELNTTCLNSEHFTYWAITPTLNTLYTFIHSPKPLVTKWQNQCILQYT